MENTFKNALRKLRNPENSLFNGFSVDWSYKSFEQLPVQTLPKVMQLSPIEKEELYKEIEAPRPEISEKKKVLDSFTQFSQDQLQESPVISFKGGEVSESNKTEHSGYLAKSANEFLEIQASNFAKDFIEARFSTKNLESPQIKVLFVSDHFVENPDKVEANELKELVCFFDEAVAHLFSRMIQAMGLAVNEYVVTALHKQMSEEDILNENLVSEILYFKPKYIVSLGAKAVNELLGTHKRLKNIHGQFFDLNFTDQSGMISKTTLMPLFSPKLLHIAANMKQTAWKDMQKLMEKL